MTKKTISVLDLAQHSQDVQRILELAEELQTYGAKYGFNVFQPGAMKELKTAYLLGHNWIMNKKKADACSRRNEEELYEYLSGTEKGSGQIDRFFKDGENEQHKKHLQSVERILRNKKFYLSFTDKNTAKPLHILRIYEVEPEKILAEAKRQLAASTNTISHIGFNEKFAQENGTLVYSE